MGASRPSQLIVHEEVDDWLADSAIRVITYHNTDRRSADVILRDGPRIERSWIGSYGQGFYTSTVPDPSFGEVPVTVAVRLRRPLMMRFDEMDQFMRHLVIRFSPLDPRLTPLQGRRIRRELLSEGYDGIIVRDAGGDGVDYVIALRDETVRVVEGQ